MNGIIGMTRLLAGTRLSETQRHYADTISNCGEMLMSLLNDILDFSKIEAQRMVLEKTEYDLMELVDGALGVVAERAAAKGLDLAGLVEQDVPVRLNGDPARVTQVLLNLLSNAVKFTENGNVSVRVKRDGTFGRDAALRFEVKDTGIGVSEEAVRRLFQPFTQADGSTTRKYGGTGLGLAISKQLSGLMGGDIGVMSEVGQGATFWFTIKTAIVAGSPTAGVPADLDGMRVLVVDDNATNREILETELRGWRMDVVSAGSPLEALRIAREAAESDRAFDIGVLDMQMPEMDGLTLAGELKTLQGNRGLHLALVTSHDEKPDREALERAGIETCFMKPIRQSHLYDELAKMTGRKCHRKMAPTAVKRHGAEDSAGLRVLLAEDNPVNQEVTLAQLKRMGYGAETVVNGLDAVEASRTGQYDVILMDCQMPEMDGYEATRIIRSEEAAGKRRRTKIVALTAHAMDGDRATCIAAGMDDYVSKPVRDDELRRAVSREIVTSGESHQAPASGTEPASAEDMIDLSRLSEAADGDPVRIDRLKHLYVQQMEESLAAMSDAVADQTPDEIRRVAHRLAGSSLTIGINGIVPVLRELEAEGKAGRLARTPALLAQVRREFESVRGLLHQIIGAPQNALSTGG